MEHLISALLYTVTLFSCQILVDAHSTRLARSLTEEKTEVVYFIVNGSRTLNVSPGMDVSFYCYINPEYRLSGEISGNGFGKLKKISFNRGSIQVPLIGVSCEDTGRYTCSVLGDVTNSTSGPTEAYVQLNVPCPQHLRYPLEPGTTLSLQSSPNTNTILTLEVYGYPHPTYFNLTQVTNASRVVLKPSRYDVTYTEWVSPNGLVALVVHDKTYENTTTYELTVGSPAGQLDVKFESVKKYPKDHVDNDDIWIGVGVGVCCAIIIILIIIVMCCVRVKRDVKDPGPDLNTDENFNFNQIDTSRAPRPTLQLYTPKNTDMMMSRL